MQVFVNGNIISEEKAHIHLKDRGLLLGDGLFETCKAQHGHILFFSEHYNRLKESAKFLSIPFIYSSDQLLNICKNLLIENDLMHGSASMRVTLTRGIGFRGINLPNDPQPTLFITALYYHPVNHHPTALITTIKRNPFSPIVAHKTLNYLEPILARAEAQSKGFDEGIMLNTDGFITECSIANIFFVKHENIITPPIESGILPGIVRNAVIHLCQQEGIPVIEKNISPSDALNADEAFQTNSLIGIQPLAAINNKKLSINQSQITQAVIKSYETTLRAKDYLSK